MVRAASPVHFGHPQQFPMKQLLASPQPLPPCSSATLQKLERGFRRRSLSGLLGHKSWIWLARPAGPAALCGPQADMITFSDPHGKKRTVMVSAYHQAIRRGPLHPIVHPNDLPYGHSVPICPPSLALMEWTLMAAS